MVRIADWPTAHAVTKLHESYGNRSQKGFPIVAVFLDAYETTTSILPCLDNTTCGVGLGNDPPCFGHFDPAILSLAEAQISALRALQIKIEA
ncbi:hypothetical protein OGR47_11975 [Methylocystis sp. MJC1]|jgi:hypothetical protein|uniref:hypothetical protein n=1 Tax=Methylocystis sp. MJC1 TaxID=2654282 RepID=UPI0020A65EB2|nr:hypothetical protein [Methylocystis sp. MJC1]UZX10633.1 hypothetical protein OGR47_11975 [Methylocystis sp. MJC1]